MNDKNEIDRTNQKIQNQFDDIFLKEKNQKASPAENEKVKDKIDTSLDENEDEKKTVVFDINALKEDLMSETNSKRTFNFNLDFLTNQKNKSDDQAKEEKSESNSTSESTSDSTSKSTSERKEESGLLIIRNSEADSSDKQESSGNSKGEVLINIKDQEEELEVEHSNEIADNQQIDGGGNTDEDVPEIDSIAIPEDLNQIINNQEISFPAPEQDPTALFPIFDQKTNEQLKELSNELVENVPENAPENAPENVPENVPESLENVVEFNFTNGHKHYSKLHLLDSDRGGPVAQNAHPVGLGSTGLGYTGPGAGGPTTQAVQKIQEVVVPLSTETATIETYSSQTSDELLKLRTTIRNLREDREQFSAKVQQLEELKFSVEQRNLHLQSQLDELKIEIVILKKRHSEEMEGLKHKFKMTENRRYIVEEKNKQYQSEIAKIGQKVRVDLTAVREREKDLENQLELLRADTENQLANRDHKILDLKRQIDTMEFDLESSTMREEEYKKQRIMLEEKIEKIKKNLKIISTITEEDHQISSQLKNFRKLKI